MVWFRLNYGLFLDEYTAILTLDKVNSSCFWFFLKGMKYELFLKFLFFLLVFDKIFVSCVLLLF